MDTGITLVIKGNISPPGPAPGLPPGPPRGVDSQGTRRGGEAMFETAELGRKVSREEYGKEEPKLRLALLQAQEKLKAAKFPVLVLISGADGAGKGEVVNLLHEWMD